MVGVDAGRPALIAILTVAIYSGAVVTFALATALHALGETLAVHIDRGRSVAYHRTAAPFLGVFEHDPYLFIKPVIEVASGISAVEVRKSAFLTFAPVLGRALDVAETNTATISTLGETPETQHQQLVRRRDDALVAREEETTTDTRLHISSDNGKTWTAADSTLTFAEGTQATIAALSDSRVVVAGTDNSDNTVWRVYIVSLAADGTLTVEQSETASAGLSVEVNSAMIGVDSGDGMWLGGRATGTSNDVYLMERTGAGSWTSHTVAAAATTNEEHPAIAIDGNDDIHVVWVEGNSTVKWDKWDTSAGAFVGTETVDTNAPDRIPDVTIEGTATPIVIAEDQIHARTSGTWETKTWTDTATTVTAVASRTDGLWMGRSESGGGTYVTLADSFADVTSSKPETQISSSGNASLDFAWQYYHTGNRPGVGADAYHHENDGSEQLVYSRLAHNRLDEVNFGVTADYVTTAAVRDVATPLVRKPLTALAGTTAGLGHFFVTIGFAAVSKIQWFTKASLANQAKLFAIVAARPRPTSKADYIRVPTPLASATDTLRPVGHKVGLARLQSIETVRTVAQYHRVATTIAGLIERGPYVFVKSIMEVAAGVSAAVPSLMVALSFAADVMTIGQRWALYFKGSGTGSYVDIPDDSSLDVGADLTLAATVSIPEDISGGSLSLRTVVIKDSAYELNVDEDAREISFTVHKDGIGETVSGGSISFDGTPITIVAIHDGSAGESTLYVDSQQVASSTSLLTGSIDSTSNSVTISDTGERCFLGTIDAVRVDARPWTSSEVDTYHTGDAPDPSEARGWYRLDEGHGATAHDTSGYGNDGTINNADWVDDITRASDALLFGITTLRRATVGSVSQRLSVLRKVFAATVAVPAAVSRGIEYVRRPAATVANRVSGRWSAAVNNVATVTTRRDGPFWIVDATRTFAKLGATDADRRTKPTKSASESVAVATAFSLLTAVVALSTMASLTSTTFSIGAVFDEDVWSFADTTSAAILHSAVVIGTLGPARVGVTRFLSELVGSVGTAGAVVRKLTDPITAGTTAVERSGVGKALAPIAATTPAASTVTTGLRIMPETVGHIAADQNMPVKPADATPGVLVSRRLGVSKGLDRLIAAFSVASTTTFGLRVITEALGGIEAGRDHGIVKPADVVAATVASAPQQKLGFRRLGERFATTTTRLLTPTKGLSEVADSTGRLVFGFDQVIVALVGGIESVQDAGVVKACIPIAGTNAERSYTPVYWAGPTAVVASSQAVSLGAGKALDELGKVTSRFAAGGRIIQAATAGLVAQDRYGVGKQVQLVVRTAPALSTLRERFFEGVVDIASVSDVRLAPTAVSHEVMAVFSSAATTTFKVFDRPVSILTTASATSAGLRIVTEAVGSVASRRVGVGKLTGVTSAVTETSRVAASKLFNRSVAVLATGSTTTFGLRIITEALGGIESGRDVGVVKSARERAATSPSALGGKRGFRRLGERLQTTTSRTVTVVPVLTEAVGGITAIRFGFNQVVVEMLGGIESVQDMAAVKALAGTVGTTGRRFYTPIYSTVLVGTAALLDRRASAITIPKLELVTGDGEYRSTPSLPKVEDVATIGDARWITRIVRDAVTGTVSALRTGVRRPFAVTAETSTSSGTAAVFRRTASAVVHIVELTATVAALQRVASSLIAVRTAVPLTPALSQAERFRVDGESGRVYDAVRTAIAQVGTVEAVLTAGALHRIASSRSAIQADSSRVHDAVREMLAQAGATAGDRLTVGKRLAERVPTATDAVGILHEFFSAAITTTAAIVSARSLTPGLYRTETAVVSAVFDTAGKFVHSIVATAGVSGAIGDVSQLIERVSELGKNAVTITTAVPYQADVQDPSWVAASVLTTGQRGVTTVSSRVYADVVASGKRAASTVSSGLRSSTVSGSTERMAAMVTSGKRLVTMAASAVESAVSSGRNDSE